MIACALKMQNTTLIVIEYIGLSGTRLNLILNLNTVEGIYLPKAKGTVGVQIKLYKYVYNFN